MAAGYRPDTWRREVLYAYSEALDELGTQDETHWRSVLDQAVLSFLERHGLRDGHKQNVHELEETALRALHQLLHSDDDREVPLLQVFALAFSGCAMHAGLIDQPVFDEVMLGIGELADDEHGDHLALPASHLPRDEHSWIEEIEGCWRNRTGGGAHTQEGPRWLAEPDDVIGQAVLHATLSRELTFSADVYPFFRKHLERVCEEREPDWSRVCAGLPQYAFASAYILFHQVLGLIGDGEGDQLRERVRNRMQNDPSGPGELLLLELELDGCPQPVRRRLLCAPSDNLFDLHRVIQACMLWDDRHPFQFDHEHRGFAGPESCAQRLGLYDADAFPLTLFFRQSGDELDYRYGSGGSWRMRVQLCERRPDHGQAVPVCLDGQCCAPPASCASPAQFAAALAQRERLPLGFCFERFDSELVEQALSRLRAGVRD